MPAQQWINILIILLVVGGPILGRLLQWLGEQKKARERQRALEAARLEALRTGQPLDQVIIGKVPESAQSPSERMQELARRRQEQLQELRRRQQQARQQGPVRAQTRTAPGPPRPAPMSRPTLPGPQQAQRQRTPPGQTPPRPQAPVRRPQTVRPLPQQRGPAQAPPRPAPPPRLAPGPTQAPPPAVRPPPPATPATKAPVEETAIDNPQGRSLPPPRQATLLGEPMSAADWRRFIIAREVLGAPLAVRPPEEPGVSP